MDGSKCSKVSNKYFVFETKSRHTVRCNLTKRADLTYIGSGYIYMVYKVNFGTCLLNGREIKEQSRERRYNGKAGWSTLVVLSISRGDENFY
jgi:hypothetical protein